MARKKKKHICAECGETFNHGIGLRKHQRQTGHKGSRIEEEGAAPPPEPPPAEAAPEPPEAAPPPAEQAQPEPAPSSRPSRPSRRRRAAAAQAPSEPEPAPQAAPPAPSPVAEEEDQTVVVQRPTPAYEDADHTVVTPHSETPPQFGPAPTQKEHRQQKLRLVGSGLKVVLSHRAKDASKQLKQSARSGADIFTEALKLAVALVCFLAIPTIVFFWWKSHNPTQRPTSSDPAVFSFDNGALAARSVLLRYLDHLGKGQLNDAYSLLSSEWQEDLTPASFKDAFLDIEDVRWAVSDQRLNPNGDADVLVRLAFREGGKNRRFVGRFRLRKSTQGWRIDRAELSPDRTS